VSPAVADPLPGPAGGTQTAITAGPTSTEVHGSGPALTVVIPVLDERDNIAPLVRRLSDSLGDLRWEVLFVDDDSRDGTAEEVTRVARADPRVRLIVRLRDPGLANACIQGMLSNTAPVLCVMDGDGQHDPAYIPQLLAVLESAQADLVSAARQPAHMQRVLAPGRSLLSRLGNRLIRLATGRSTQDPLSGFFVIRRGAFLAAVRGLSNSGFKLLFDLLASRPALRHAEIPFQFRERQHGESKLNALVLWQFGLLLLEKLSRGWLPVRVMSFVGVGMSGLLVHMLVLYLLMALGLPFLPAHGAAAFTAMSSNFFLNNLLTFGDRRFRGRGLLLGWLAYVAICAVGLAANVSAARWVFDRTHGLVALSALAGIVLDVAWKFIISDKLLWRPRRR
jgi:dolichol-phosphate mannosyltransferase